MLVSYYLCQGMSLILDFGDKRQGFLFKNSCYNQKLHNESETLQKLHFWTKFRKNEENGHQSRK